LSWWHKYTRGELTLFGIGYALAAVGLLLTFMNYRLLGIALTVAGGLIVIPTGVRVNQRRAAVEAAEHDRLGPRRRR
jgi:hypothetical protein